MDDFDEMEALRRSFTEGEKANAEHDRLCHRLLSLFSVDRPRSIEQALQDVGVPRRAFRRLRPFLREAHAVGWLEGGVASDLRLSASGRSALARSMDSPILVEMLSRALDERPWKPGEGRQLMVTRVGEGGDFSVGIAFGQEPGILELCVPYREDAATDPYGLRFLVGVDELTGTLLDLFGSGRDFIFRSVEAVGDSDPEAGSPEPCKSGSGLRGDQPAIEASVAAAAGLDDRQAWTVTTELLSALLKLLHEGREVRLPGFCRLRLARAARSLALPWAPATPGTVADLPLVRMLLDQGDGHVTPQAGFGGLRLGMSTAELVDAAQAHGWVILQDGEEVTWTQNPGVWGTSRFRFDGRTAPLFDLTEEEVGSHHVGVTYLCLVSDAVLRGVPLVVYALALDGVVYGLEINRHGGGTFPELEHAVGALDGAIRMHRRHVTSELLPSDAGGGVQRVDDAEWALPAGLNGIAEPCLLVRRISRLPDRARFGAQLDDEIWFMDLRRLGAAVARLVETVRRTAKREACPE